MKHSTGFLTLPLAGYAALGAALVIGVLGLWGWVEKQRYEALKAEYEQFKGGVKALGEAAKKAAAEKEAADIKRKADTDALHQAAVDALNADLRRLRNQRSPSGGLPQAPAASSRPDLACFDRPLLAGALRALDGDFQEIAGEGAAATIDLNSAKAWAQH